MSKKDLKHLSKLDKGSATFFAGDVSIDASEGEHAMITAVRRHGKTYEAVHSVTLRPNESAVCWLGVADDDILGSYGVELNSKRMGTKQHAVARRILNNRKISCRVFVEAKSSVEAFYKGKSFKGDNMVPGCCFTTRKVDRYDMVVVDKDTFDRGLGIVTVLNTGKCDVELQAEKGFIEKEREFLF